MVCYINVPANGERPYDFLKMPSSPPAWVVSAAIRHEVSFQHYYRENPEVKKPTQDETDLIREVPRLSLVVPAGWRVNIRPESWAAVASRPKHDRTPRMKDVQNAWTDKDCIQAMCLGSLRAIDTVANVQEDPNDCLEKPTWYRALKESEKDNPIGPRSGEALADMYRE